MCSNLQSIGWTPKSSFLRKKKKTTYIYNLSIPLSCWFQNTTLFRCILTRFKCYLLGWPVLELKGLGKLSPCFSDYLSVPPYIDESNEYILLLYKYANSSSLHWEFWSAYCCNWWWSRSWWECSSWLRH